MLLKEQYVTTGNWLFYKRGYLPLFSFSIFALALPYFNYPESNHILYQKWKILCLMISFSGLAIRAITVGCTPKRTSGRNTKKGQVADTLNTTGMYSIVRHPLYLGNFMIWLGISLTFQLWWFSLICVLIFWMYYEKIIFAEEDFLSKKFSNEYFSWTGKAPAFFPKFKNWQKAYQPFSLRMVIKKEYQTFFMVITTFTILEIVADTVVQDRFTFDKLWLIFFVVNLVIFLALRVLRKKTRILHTNGKII